MSYLALLLPNYTAAQLQPLQTFFTETTSMSLLTNTQAFRAQGAETTLESGIGRNIFLRGGYTYTDPWCSAPSPAITRLC